MTTTNPAQDTQFPVVVVVHCRRCHHATRLAWSRWEAQQRQVVDGDHMTIPFCREKGCGTVEDMVDLFAGAMSPRRSPLQPVHAGPDVPDFSRIHHDGDSY